MQGGRQGNARICKDVVSSCTSVQGPCVGSEVVCLQCSGMILVWSCGVFAVRMVSVHGVCIASSMASWLVQTVCRVWHEPAC